MGWIEDLEDDVIALDTSPFIYFIEENRRYLPIIQPVFEAIDAGRMMAVTSTVTLLEVLVHPFRAKNDALARRYRDVLTGAVGLAVIPLSESVAEEAARLRAEHNLRTPDAIQLATAITEEASVLLTNDARLPSLASLRVLTLDSLQV